MAIPRFGESFMTLKIAAIVLEALAGTALTFGKKKPDA